MKLIDIFDDEYFNVREDAVNHWLEMNTCGCVGFSQKMIVLTIDFIDYLVYLYSEGKQRYSDETPYSLFSDAGMEDQYYFIAGILSNEDFIEHGSSIRRVRITDFRNEPKKFVELWKQLSPGVAPDFDYPTEKQIHTRDMQQLEERRIANGYYNNRPGSN